MKIWHDDVRPPPEDWVWAKNNDEAKDIFAVYGDEVVAISLDHDLGAKPEDGLYARGLSEDNGLKLVDWMIETGNLPAEIIIHSWNPVGAQRMWAAFYYAGVPALVEPYRV